MTPPAGMKVLRRAGDAAGVLSGQYMAFGVPQAAAGQGLWRKVLYLPAGNGQAIFAWYHSDDSVQEHARQQDCVAVICPPMGHEYVHSHRSIRHLADRLAQAGIPALRFDYRGTGDSPENDLDPGRWAAWQEDVLAAVRGARRLSAQRRVCLLGVRLGAALAATVAGQLDVDLLALWAPVINGRRHLREWRAMAASAARSRIEGEPLEGGGLVLSDETAAAIRAVDLLSCKFRITGRALVMGRDELAPNKALNQRFAELGIANDYASAPGFEGMMAEPQFTEVPVAALGTIVDWVKTNSRVKAPGAPTGPGEGRLQAVPQADGDRLRDKRVDEPRNKPLVELRLAGSALRESPCRFGEGQRLFGILTRPAGRARAAVLMFNAGSVHHVGPSRLYVSLARALAAQGYAALRFDLMGIGDSVAGEGVENHPYPPTAQRDAIDALEFLRQRCGYRRFVLLGLCSGAHAAFHAALGLPARRFDAVILINPLTYRWVEGMSLETSRRAQDVSYYKQYLRKPGSWPALARRGIPWRKATDIAASHLATLWHSHYAHARELVAPRAASPLSRELERLQAMDRRITLVLAEGDPGLDIMLANARRMARKGLKSGLIRVHTIADADHTFTRSGPRRELLDYLCGLLEPTAEG
jgi:alpha-beta hydrolase superfamily lysophospholipase